MILIEAVLTAAEVYEPDNAIGLAGLVIIGLPATLAAIGTVVMLWKSRSSDRDQRVIKGQVGVIRDNVQNGHPDPLRADLDKQFDSIRETLEEQNRYMRARFSDQSRDTRGVRTEIGGLRGELRNERDARIRLEQRFDDDRRRPPTP